MAEKKSKVTLSYKSGGRYRVIQIAGSTPTVLYGKPFPNGRPGGTGEIVRVDSVLTEEEATLLGNVADLVIKPAK